MNTEMERLVDLQIKLWLHNHPKWSPHNKDSKKISNALLVTDNEEEALAYLKEQCW